MSEPTLHDDPGNRPGNDPGNQTGQDDSDAGVAGVHEWTAEPTGDAQVDDALALLADLDTMAVHEHAGVVERVHHVLQDRLADGQD